MSTAIYLARAADVLVRASAVTLKLEANEKNYCAACLAEDKAEQVRLREERHTLTDALLDLAGERQHYIRLAIRSTR